MQQRRRLSVPGLQRQVVLVDVRPLQQRCLGRWLLCEYFVTVISPVCGTAPVRAHACCLCGFGGGRGGKSNGSSVQARSF